METQTPVWTEISPHPLSVDQALDAVGGARAGGVVVFIGTVREHDGGRDGVVRLDYSVHPDAESRLRHTAEQVARRDGVTGVVAIHREGSLAVGDRAVVCAVSAEHRGEAFEACRALIDELKAEVPIWKHQQFDGGTQEWVGADAR